jgi:uncharacterized membrane protein YGL010W
MVKFIKFSIKLLWQFFRRLNILEQFLIPTLILAHNYLFTSSSLGKSGLKVAILFLVLVALLYSSFEVKNQLENPAKRNSLFLAESLFKAGTWGFACLEIIHSLSLFTE